MRGSAPAFIFPAAAAPRAIVFPAQPAASHQKNPPFLFLRAYVHFLFTEKPKKILNIAAGKQGSYVEQI